MTTFLLLVLPLLSGCAPEAAEDCGSGFELSPDGLCYAISSTSCAEGFTLEDDGLCYQDSALILPSDIVDSWPACKLLDPGLYNLDIDNGCVDDACAQTTLAEFIEALDEVPECTPVAASSLWCTWPSATVAVAATDANADGEPDLNSEVTGFWVYSGSQAVTSTGLGGGVSLSCLYAEYGMPDRFSVADTPAGPAFEWVAWSHIGLWTQDLRGMNEEPDGYAEWLWISGPGGG